MSWTAPRTWVASEVVTASIMNTHVRDNLTEVRAGGVAIASQAALDFVYASSATQLARLAAGTALQFPRINAAGNAWEFATLSISSAWPIGAVFIAVVSTNPATLLGFGTWAAFGAGRMLVGLNSGDADFDTVEETGGAKTHALTEAELASHTHTQNAHTHTQDAHGHGVTESAHTHELITSTSGSGAPQVSQGASPGTGSGLSTGAASTGLSVNNATATNQNATATNNATGSGTAHNNMPPYIVVYMWKRTA